MEKTITMTFTDAEWAEIYYAIDYKRSAVIGGFFGDDAKAKKWAIDLESVREQFEINLRTAEVNY